MIVCVFNVAAFKLQMPSRQYHIRTISMSEQKYDIVPLEKTNIQSAAAVTGGVVGLALGGPFWALLFAAVSNYVAKKEDDTGDALRGFGKTVIESYNFLNKINSKYELTSKVTDAASKAINSVQVESESVSTIKTTYSQVVEKIDNVNKEYDLVGKGKEFIGLAATFTDAAIEKVVELNAKVR